MTPQLPAGVQPGDTYFILPDGAALAFDMDRLTIGELCDLQDAAGGTISEIGERAERSDIRAVMAMLYVAWRRKDPAVTVDDVRALDAGVLELHTAADEAGEAEEAAIQALPPADVTPPAAGSSESAAVAALPA